MGLALPRDPNEPPWEAAALVIILITLKILVYIALCSRTKAGRYQ